MGRFASTALLSTIPYWYTLSLARTVVLGLHLLLGISLYSLFYSCVRDRRVSIVGTVTLLALYVSQLSNPYDSLYRITGLFIYQTGLIGTLVLANLLWRGKLMAALPVVLLTAGTNEISLLHVGLLVGGYLMVVPRSLKSAKGMALISVALLSAYAALAAPGNWVRAELYLAEAVSIPQALGLAVASGVYLLLSWVSSTTLLPVLLLASAFLPRVELSRRQRLITFGTALLLPILSVLPVVVATRGQSLPEGIADWQIVPVTLLLGLWVASFPRFPLSAKPSLVLATFVGCANLFGGLRIDRDRSGPARSATERIVIDAPPGAAWLQLGAGKIHRYSESVERQYDAIARCRQTPCYVPATSKESNFLYDGSYDRRTSTSGDEKFGYLVNRKDLRVIAREQRPQD